MSKISMREVIEPTSWNVNAVYKWVEQSDATTLLVEFPGANYSTDKPVFHYANKMAVPLGYDILMLEYGYQAARAKFDFNPEEMQAIVKDLSGVLNMIDPNKYQRIIFYSKSLGTYIAGLSAAQVNYAVEHVFLTPVGHTISYINENPDCLVITGSNDPMFGEEERNKVTSGRMHVIQDADHGLETGDWQQSLRTMEEVMTLVYDYIK